MPYQLLKRAIRNSLDDGVLRFGAAMAYYTSLAVVPLTVLTIQVGKLMLGADTAERLLVGQVKDVVGDKGADVVKGMLQHWLETGSWVGPTVVAVIALVFAAAGAFDQLQQAVNTIWGVQQKDEGSVAVKLRRRFISVLGVLGTAFLLIVTMGVNALLLGLSHASERVPESTIWFESAQSVVAYAAMTVLFMLIFKLLPRAKVSWSDVWIGAVVTAALFVAGKWAVMVYLSNSVVVASYGSAGSFVVILLWALYTSNVLLFGAEFTAVYCRECGKGTKPTEDAVAIREAARAG